MFDLTGLQSVQKRLDERDHRQQARVSDSYAIACGRLEQYKLTGEPQLVRQAMQQLVETIKLSRKYPEPYLLLAYLYYGLKLPQIAVRYLRAAEEIAPDSRFLKDLKLLFSQGKGIPLIERQTAGPQKTAVTTAKVEPDYDALYDEMYSYIKDEVRNALEMATPPRPSFAPEDLKALEEQAGHLKQVLNFCRDQLEIIGQDIDPSELEQLLKPIRMREQQVRRMLANCYQFAELNQQIQGQRQQVQTLIQQSRAHLPVSSGQLDTLLDGCDAVADQLDAITDKGIAIHSLEQPYQALVTEITLLQDLIDSD